MDIPIFIKQCAKHFLPAVFFGVGLAFLLFAAPSHASAACPTKTEITYPLDGQNFVTPLPFSLIPMYNVHFSDKVYVLELYKGVPGNATLVDDGGFFGTAGGTQRIFGCSYDPSWIDHEKRIINENGDYFYVLYTIDQIYGWKTLMDTASWENHWEHGGDVHDIWGNPFMPTDYALSRFSIGSTRIPIVLVPGIGSAFNMDVLVKDKQPGSGSWNFLPGMPYDNFVKSLGNAGYRKDKDLFVAYYDWRKSNDINASDNSVGAYLIPTIDKAKSLCGCSKVALVAHSMGGLAARSYMQSDLYSQRNDVSHLFLIGTPNQGSSNVYDLWEGGHISHYLDGGVRAGIYAYTWLRSDDKIAATDPFDRGDPARYTVIHNNIPSVQQLLPTYDYLAFSGLPPNTLEPILEMIEKNPFLPALNQNTDLLSKRTNLYTFVGENQPTVNAISVVSATMRDVPRWIDGHASPEDPVPNDTKGDNQVLLSSSRDPLIADVIQNYTYSADHGAIVTDSAPDIAKILANASIPEPDSFAEPQNSLVYAVTSSADISITDPSGKTIGKSQNTIGSDAEYFSGSDPGDTKIVFINNPVQGNYQVNLQGEGNGGSFQMLAGSITQNGSDSSAVQQNTIASSQTITYNSSYQPATDQTDSSITLDTIDTAPPAISVQAPLQQNYNRTDKITIDISATDAASGVSSTTITLDGTIKQNGGTIDLSTLALGQHTLVIDAKDNAGNDAQQSVTFTNTVTTQDIIKDIQKVVSCGCVSKRSVAQALLDDTDAIAQAADADAKQTAIQNFSQFFVDKRGKAISEGAYQLLSNDINWIH